MRGYMVIGRNETRKNASPSRPDDKIVIAAAYLDASHLDDPKPAALGSVEGSKLLQADDGMADAVQIEIVVLGRHVVEQKDGRVVEQEETLECQDLSAV